jgi:hypothetical protein
MQRPSRSFRGKVLTTGDHISRRERIPAYFLVPQQVERTRVRAESSRLAMESDAQKNIIGLPHSVLTN